MTLLNNLQLKFEIYALLLNAMMSYFFQVPFVAPKHFSEDH